MSYNLAFILGLLIGCDEKKANYAKFAGQIMRLEGPIMR